ncbi:hypothetical protein HMPREF9551_03434 [Escherichia coli MS 196-1]|nr:hypothetical protein HMPREF9551_03434 [Escherichia coli MS 196-1]
MFSSAPADRRGERKLQGSTGATSPRSAATPLLLSTGTRSTFPPCQARLTHRQR